MTQQQFLNFYQNYKPGTYTKVIKEKTSGNYKKITCVVMRFVNYFNIKTVKENATTTQRKINKNELQIIPHVLKLNTNTNNLLLCAYTTNKHKAHNKYFYNGEEISKEEYYLKSGEKEHINNSVVYSFKLNDVLSIGE